MGEAREAAYADARRRAEHLAALADATLGEVEAVVDGGAGARAVPVALAMAADVRLEPGRDRARGFAAGLSRRVGAPSPVTCG